MSRVFTGAAMTISVSASLLLTSACLTSILLIKSQMIRKLAIKWRQYRYRFVPWLMMNLKDRSMRSVPSGHMDTIVSDETVKVTLIEFFTQLHQDTPVKITLKSPPKCSKHIEVCDQSLKCSVLSSSNMAEMLCRDRNVGAIFAANVADKWKTILRDRNFGVICAANIADKWKTILKSLLHSANVGARTVLDFGQKLTSLSNKCTVLESCSTKSINLDNRHLNISCLEKGNITRYSTKAYRDLMLRAEARQGCFHYGSQPHAVHGYHTDIDKSMEEVFLKRMKQQAGCAHVAKRALRIMYGSLGFCIERCESVIPGGGMGVRVTKGVIPKHQVVAIYPGSVYLPSEAIFFQSLGNPFIFRCIDNIHIDGNDKGLSRFIYRSCGNRDRVGLSFTCDLSWLTPYPGNPMAVGQYVNNQSSGYPANVAYQEFDVPVDFPFHLRQYMPNNFYSPIVQEMDSTRLLRTVVLVSLREIQENEELFSSYFTVVH